jgi:lipocalin
MKKIVLSILMLLLFQVNLFSDLNKTDGWYNGNFWLTLDEADQAYFIVGSDEGTCSIFYKLYSQIKIQKTKNLIAKIFYEEYYREGTTYQSAIGFLNKFYSTAKYRIIPIDTALRWFFLSANGKIAVKEIDVHATEKLKFYKKNPPTMTEN